MSEKTINYPSFVVDLQIQIQFKCLQKLSACRAHLFKLIYISSVDIIALFLVCSSGFMY